MVTIQLVLRCIGTTKKMLVSVLPIKHGYPLLAITPKIMCNYKNRKFSAIWKYSGNWWHFGKIRRWNMAVWKWAPSIKTCSFIKDSSTIMTMPMSLSFCWTWECHIGQLDCRTTFEICHNKWKWLRLQFIRKFLWLGNSIGFLCTMRFDFTYILFDLFLQRYCRSKKSGDTTWSWNRDCWKKATIQFKMIEHLVEMLNFRCLYM